MISELNWYALWTRSRYEKRVRDDLQERSIEAFLPTVQRWSRWKDRRKRIEWPLFPGYCFARFDSGERLSVLRCNGVVTIVGVDGVPVAIPQEEIRNLRRLVESELLYDPCPLVKVGDVVQVVSGPLKGLTGQLLRKGAQARLVLSVNIIAQGVSVEVDAADVRPC